MPRTATIERPTELVESTPTRPPIRNWRKWVSQRWMPIGLVLAALILGTFGIIWMSDATALRDEATGLEDRADSAGAALVVSEDQLATAVADSAELDAAFAEATAKLGRLEDQLTAARADWSELDAEVRPTALALDAIDKDLLAITEQMGELGRSLNGITERLDAAIEQGNVRAIDRMRSSLERAHEELAEAGDAIDRLEARIADLRDSAAGLEEEPR